MNTWLLLHSRVHKSQTLKVIQSNPFIFQLTKLYSREGKHLARRSNVVGDKATRRCRVSCFQTHPTSCHAPTVSPCASAPWHPESKKSACGSLISHKYSLNKPTLLWVVSVRRNYYCHNINFLEKDMVRSYNAAYYENQSNKAAR